MVRDLVSRQAGFGAEILRHVVEGAAGLVVRGHQLAGGREAVERRARLDCQLIEAQMLGRPRQSFAQLGPPRGRRLAGAGVDQVEGRAREDRLGDLDRRQRLRRVVEAAERPQGRVVQRLYAERDAVDAGRAVAAEAAGLDTRRVRLQGDLGVGRHAPVARHGLKQAGDRRGLHQRGRPAAQEDAGDFAPRRARGVVGDLGAERVEKARLVHARVADMAVEVAIRALRRAEGPVQVDPEARVAGRVVRAYRCHDRRDVSARGPFGNQDAGARHARLRSTKARARCESPAPICQSTPCFSSAVISPNVRSCPSGRKIGS